MHVIAIANEKGGVAKTTTTISLGAALAGFDQKVLLIDLDAQANLSLALGLEPGKVQKSTANLLLENATLGQIIQSTRFDGLDLLPSNHYLVYAERFLPVRQHYTTVLHQAIQESAASYHYVLIDCPPFLGAVTRNALAAANLLLVPTQAEFFSIYALRNLMAMVRQVRAQENSTLTYRILLTMFDRRNRTHRLLAEQLRATFNNGVFETVVEIDTKLRESPIAGIPIHYHAPKSRASEQYLSLARELMG